MVDRPAHSESEIEVTPEMIEAGTNALLEYNIDSFNPVEIRKGVCASFLAMMKFHFPKPL